MADRVLFISWEAARPGREERALEVFNEAIGICGRKQQEGAIERFDVSLMMPNAALGGYVAIFGTAAQIDALAEDPEFVRNQLEANVNVGGLATTRGVTGEGIAERMTVYREIVTQLPQLA